MLIGSSFNKKLELIIATSYKLLSEESIDRIPVERLNRELTFDKTELKNYLEYLSEKGFLTLPTIGGPLLYGHLELTPKGLRKARELVSKK